MSTQRSPPAASTADFEYDVAVSFLSADLDLAHDLRDRLQPQLRVFVYDRAQEAVAASDGLDSFRTIFRDRSRVSVVLFRRGWGNTPWTGVEEIAIKDRCLATKYRSLVLVALDGSETPSWVPDGYIHFDRTSYSIEELVGVIKARAQTLGANLREPTLAEKAATIERARAFDAETLELLRRVPNPYDEVADDLCNAVRQQAAAVAADTGWDMAVGPCDPLGGFIVSAQGQTIQIANLRRYTNSTDDAALEFREFACTLHVAQPGNRRYYIAGRMPEPVSARRVPVRRLPHRGWCWELDGKPLTPVEAGAAVMRLLLERIGAERKRQGHGYGDGRVESESYDPDDP